jgi:methionine synthase II (cobalamin-independent)
MRPSFPANGLPLLIGSLPLTDYRRAAELVWRFTPEIPLWVQLPRLPGETITRQFAAGLPGLREADGRAVVDPGDTDALLAFYEEAVAVQDGTRDLNRSRFALDRGAAGGFFELLAQVADRAEPPLALKGQIIGPVTFGTSYTDREGKAIFYDPQLREAAAKLLALRARWQVRQLAACGLPVLLFVDDPALTAFGSSIHIGMTREDICQSLAEVVEAIQAEGGLAGVHVCANTDWTLILDSAADILSFDAYTFTDQLLLYRDAIRRFLGRGGTIAWGLVPTLDPADIERETVASLHRRWTSICARLEEIGIDRVRLTAQSLITPACGMGTLSEDHAVRALELTRALSQTVRSSR